MVGGPDLPERSGPIKLYRMASNVAERDTRRAVMLCVVRTFCDNTGAPKPEPLVGEHDLFPLFLFVSQHSEGGMRR